MDNPIILFLSTALTALAIQNVVFTRALGLSKTIMFMNRPKTGILYGTLLTFTVTISAILVGGVNIVLAQFSSLVILTPLVYLVCVCLVYILTYIIAQKKLPKLFPDIQKALPLSVFNSALFGVFYIAGVSKYNFLQTVAYALGAGIGYTLAILIIYYARKRLAICPVTRSWRGLPILLLYIGFISLALYGLIGHGLPT